MKIDSAIKVFSEKYDRAAMESIDRISKDLGLINRRDTIKAFNINESFDKFQQYLKGYAQYKVENKENPKASSQDVICESVTKFIDTQVLKDDNILYSKIPEFVEAYVNGINELIKTTDEVKSVMTEAEVPADAVGNVNDFVDQFITKITESFDQTMDRILWASGYNSKKVLSGNNKKEKKPVFL